VTVLEQFFKKGIWPRFEKYSAAKVKSTYEICGKLRQNEDDLRQTQEAQLTVRVREPRAVEVN